MKKYKQELPQNTQVEKSEFSYSVFLSNEVVLNFSGTGSEIKEKLFFFIQFHSLSAGRYKRLRLRRQRLSLFGPCYSNCRANRGLYRYILVRHC